MNNNLDMTLVTKLTHAVCGALDKLSTQVDALRDSLKGHLSPEELRQILLVPVARYYKCGTKEKQRGEGVTFDRDSATFETAKKRLDRIIALLTVPTAGQSEDLDVPAEIQRVADKLVAMCAEYERAGKLRAKAIANATAKK